MSVRIACVTKVTLPLALPCIKSNHEDKWTRTLTEFEMTHANSSGGNSMASSDNVAETANSVAPAVASKRPAVNMSGSSDKPMCPHCRHNDKVRIHDTAGC
jgi:hypothetical protein